MTTTTMERPRSLVSHIKNLAGVEPVEARKFIESACDAARKRLGIRPARVKYTKRTSREGRHVLISVGDGAAGRTAARIVRRRNLRTGRHTFAQVMDKATVRRARRRKPIRVFHYTPDQVQAILAEAKPRKAAYKEMRERALARLAERENGGSRLNARRLPRQRRWSKRRNRR